MIEVAEHDGCVIFAVRVAPRASRNAIEGEHAGALKVRLTAPPVEGRANEALRRLLAEHLNVPVGAVRIVAGEANRTKRVSVAGVSPAQVLALCAPHGKRAAENGRHSRNPG
jgi:uncharacterized protein